MQWILQPEKVIPIRCNNFLLQKTDGPPKPSVFLVFQFPVLYFSLTFYLVVFFSADEEPQPRCSHASDSRDCCHDPPGESSCLGNCHRRNFFFFYRNRILLRLFLHFVTQCGLLLCDLCRVLRYSYGGICLISCILYHLCAACRLCGRSLRCLYRFCSGVSAIIITVSPPILNARQF